MKKNMVLFLLCLISLVVGSYVLFREFEKEKTEDVLRQDTITIAKTKLTDTTQKTVEIKPEKNLDVLPPEELKEVIKDGTYGLLVIPKLSLSVPVTKGIDNNVLKYFVGMYPTSDEPGTSNGNTALAAHSVIPNTGNCAYCYFNEIDTLKKGDIISLYWKDGKEYTYEVGDIFAKEKKDATHAYTKIEDNSILTLVTCSDGDDRYRTFVSAYLKK